MIFEFLEERELSSGRSYLENGDLEEDENYGDREEKRLFWQTQEHHLTVNIIFIRSMFFS